MSFKHIFGKNMRAILGLLGLLITISSLAACDSEITNVASYPSPDGKFVLAVVTELQAANDPTPWWTHVSLRRYGEDLRKISGNIVVLEGRGRASAQWLSPSRVMLNLEGEFNNLKAITSEKRIKDITVVLVINQSR